MVEEGEGRRREGAKWEGRATNVYEYCGLIFLYLSKSRWRRGEKGARIEGRARKPKRKGL